MEGYTAAYDVAENAGISHKRQLNPKGTSVMKLSTIVAGSAASVLLLHGLAFAQQQSDQQGQGQQLSNREVKQFMSGVERDVNQIVQSGDISRLRPWTQSHVADNAVLNRTNSIETEGHSRVISSVTITKPDLLRLQHFAFSNLSEKMNNIEDFHLRIQVLNVEPVGDSAAIVKTRLTERATLVPHRGEGGSRFSEQREGQRGEFTTGQGPKSEMQAEEDEEEMSRQHGRQQPSRGQQGGVQLESQATCTHMLQRNKDSGRLQIGMGICDATTQAEL